MGSRRDSAIISELRATAATHTAGLSMEEEEVISRLREAVAVKPDLISMGTLAQALFDLGRVDEAAHTFQVRYTTHTM